MIKSSIRIDTVPGAKRLLVIIVQTVVILSFAFIIFKGVMKPGEAAAQSPTPAKSVQAAPTDAGEIPFLNEEAGNIAPPNGRNWIENLLDILFRLSLAVILSGILAFRPRQNVSLFKRSLFVSQTQILLSVVAAALMMIVGDNAARAFAIFAAVSLVRFRTNIRDPKEITVLLISLALGLAAGTGRWELGIALCLFALILLWLLEQHESEQVFRSMELTIRTRDTERVQRALKKLFLKNKIDAEVREFDPPDEKDPVGAVVYYVTLPLNFSIDSLSDQILRIDPDNMEGIQWSQKKSAADIYQ